MGDKKVNLAESSSVEVKEYEKKICKWPTDTFEIDHYDSDNNAIYPRVVFLFIPGNPGCAGWYISMLKVIVEKLGRNYSCRAVSYAGHGTSPHLVRGDDGREVTTAWSVDGQTEHKIEWIDMVSDDFEMRRRANKSWQCALPKFIFISHSFGAHLVQRTCILREDILIRTQAMIHLMPFTRYDPVPKWKGTVLSALANNPDIIISILQMGSRFAARIPHSMLNHYLEHFAGVSLVEDRKLARGLIINDKYAENFFKLGSEEIRDIPQQHDSVALRLIGRVCPTYLLYCGGTSEDHWAPSPHLRDLEKDISTRTLPDNIFYDNSIDLEHGFIVFPHMVEVVVDYILKSVHSSTKYKKHEHSMKAKL